MKVFLFTIFFLLFPIALFSQEESLSEPLTVNPEVDALLDSSLTFAEIGEWVNALNAISDAEKLDPLDPRIPSYKSSILELQALDEAQQSWAAGTAVDVKPVDTDGEQDTEPDDNTPKFVIDRGENDMRNPPSDYRDALRFDLGLKTFAVNPLTSETINTWSSPKEFFLSSLRADFRYWIPFLSRSLGFNFRSNGYSWTPGEPDILFNALDLGINLRGFLLENEVSRLELGLDFGASLLTTNDTTLGVDYNWSLYLGLWGSDPLFFHIFKVESLEQLIFGGGLRIYSSNSQEILETVNYRLDAAWNFNRGFSGIRFEWWDFSIDIGSVNVMSFSLFGGFRY